VLVADHLPKLKNEVSNHISNTHNCRKPRLDHDDTLSFKSIRDTRELMNRQVGRRILYFNKIQSTHVNKSWKPFRSSTLVS
jgi:hypothetical protein